MKKFLVLAFLPALLLAEPIIGPEFGAIFRVESPKLPAGVPIAVYKLFLGDQEVKLDTSYRVKPGTYCLTLEQGIFRTQMCNINLFGSSITKRQLAAVLFKRQVDFVPDVGPRRTYRTNFAPHPFDVLKPGESQIVMAIPGMQLQTIGDLNLGNEKKYVGAGLFSLQPGEVRDLMAGRPDEWTRRLMIKPAKRKFPDVKVAGNCVSDKNQQIVIATSEDVEHPYLIESDWPYKPEEIEKIVHLSAPNLSVHPKDVKDGKLALSHGTLRDFFGFLVGAVDFRINASDLGYFGKASYFHVANGTYNRFKLGVGTHNPKEPYFTNVLGRRIDVGQVTFASPEGIHKVQGEYRVWKSYWSGKYYADPDGQWVWRQAFIPSTEKADCSGKITYHDFFPTSTGIDVAKGLYKVEIRYPIEDPQNTIYQEVDLSSDSVTSVALGE